MSEVPTVVKLAQTVEHLFQAYKQNYEASVENTQQTSIATAFTDKEEMEYNELIQQIKDEALRKLTQFYQGKVNQKTEFYQNGLNQFHKINNEIESQTDEFQSVLSDGIVAMRKKKQNKDAQTLQKIIETETILLKRKSFLQFKKYLKKRQRQTQQKIVADQFYTQRLQKRTFNYWRSDCSKQGYQNRLVADASKDIKNIQSYFTEIIKTLRGKIAETDDLIQVKKSAKAEFSYSISRNLLKTISNLSMEVISLNQVVIKDGEVDQDENTKFLKEINGIMNQKIQEINQFRESLTTKHQDEKKQHQI